MRLGASGWSVLSGRRPLRQLAPGIARGLACGRAAGRDRVRHPLLLLLERESRGLQALLHTLPRLGERIRRFVAHGFDPALDLATDFLARARREQQRNA